mgnify:FL=1
MALPEGFDAEVYSVVAQIPAGRVTTYGQIARLIGMPGYARRVGHALAAAPAGLPCHRVVNSAGRTAPHWTEQRPMLEAEGVRFRKKRLRRSDPLGLEGGHSLKAIFRGRNPFCG